MSGRQRSLVRVYITIQPILDSHGRIFASYYREPLSPSDWARLMFYARRIESFDSESPRSYTSLGITQMYQALDVLSEINILLRNCSLMLLEVQGSPIENAMDVAAFLSDIFPDIEEIDSMAGASQGVDADRSNQTWDEAGAFLPTLRSIRKQG
jgi:hypothetical protein